MLKLRKKPINILYEIAFFVISPWIVSAILYFAIGIKGANASTYFAYQIYGSYFVLTIVIALRTFRKKQMERLPISTFLFGFTCGFYFWGLFIISESHTITSFLDFLFAILVCTVAGTIFGLVAIPVGYASFGIFSLKKLKGER